MLRTTAAALIVKFTRKGRKERSMPHRGTVVFPAQRKWSRSTMVEPCRDRTSCAARA